MYTDFLHLRNLYPLEDNKYFLKIQYFFLVGRYLQLIEMWTCDFVHK